MSFLTLAFFYFSVNILKFVLISTHLNILHHSFISKN